MVDSPDDLNAELEALAASPAPADNMQDSLNAELESLALEQQQEDKEEKYGTAGQMLKTAAEGLAEGVLTSPISRKLEIASGLATAEDIRNREEINPALKGGTEVLGLVAPAIIPGAQGSLLARVGQGALLAKASMAGAKAVGLGAAKAGFVNQVGHHTIRGAFEGVLYQSSKELGDMVIADPDTAAEFSLVDVGITGALSGVFGGAFGVAAQGLKKVAPGRFVSELDNPALEAGDLRATIEHSDIIAPHKKQGLLDGLMEQKPDAKEIKAAAERLGAPVMEGMTSASPHIQKLEDSLINGAATVSGVKRQQMYSEGFRKASGAVDEAIGAEGVHTKAELGNIMKDTIVKQIDEQNAPIAQLYDEIKLLHDVIPLSEDAGAIVASSLESLKELKISPSSPEGQLVKRVLKEIEGLKTVDDVKTYKSILNRSISPTAPSGEKRMAGIISDQLTQLEENSIVGFSKKIGRPEDNRVPSENARALANQYNKSAGLPPVTDTGYAPINQETGKAIADAYEAMKHEPNNPKVKKAYDSLIDETLSQYRRLKAYGLTVEKIKPGMANPYKNSKQMVEDVTNNSHMWYYPTESGFGATGAAEAAGGGHPLLRLTNEVSADGENMLANDILRIVHDFYGHAKEGVGFGARGEENAWREHMKMYSKEAQKALTTETRGQNSWVNFGPKGAANRVDPSKTVYAEQKAGLLPDWAMKVEPVASHSKPDELVHYSQAPETLSTISPKFQGTGKAGKESRRLGPKGLERQYYYEPNTSPEDLVTQGAKNVYHIKRPGKIVDLASPEGRKLLDAAGTGDMSEVEKFIKAKGFSGYKNSDSELPNAVALFGEHPVIRQEPMGPEQFYKINELRQAAQSERKTAGLIGARKEANAQYKQFIGKVQTLSEQLGKGRVYGAQDAINFIKDLTPEQITQRLFSKNNSEFLKFFSKEFPEQFELMKNYQKSALRDAASKTGELSPKVLFNNINKLEPEIQRALFNPQELQRLRDAETYIRAIPKNFNPSGTSGMNAAREFFKSPTGMAMGNARDFAIEQFIKLSNMAPEVKNATSLGSSTVKGWKTTAKAVRSVFEASKEMPHNVIPIAASRLKLDKLVVDSIKTPERLIAINDNNPVPEYSQAYGATAARAVQYLNTLRPDTDPKSPLDAKMPANSTQTAAYHRALDIAQQPLVVLKHIKDSTLTPQDIVTIKTIYPGLYDQLSQKLMSQMVEHLNKGEAVPYATRLSLSMFLGQALDSTMTPTGISSSQPTPEQQAQRQQQQGKAPAASSMKGLDKMSTQYRTPSQAAEMGGTQRSK